MIKLLVAGCLCAAVFMLPLAQGACSNKEWSFYQPEGEDLTVDEAAKKLLDYDVILFGEFHDQAAVHQAESEFLQSLYKQTKQLAISFEMFECDTQEYINKYLGGQISETDFLANSRPWPNYQTDYRRLMEFAKLNKLPVIAANVPRRLAAQYSKGMTLSDIPTDEQAYLPKRHSLGSNAYSENFRNYMTSGQTAMKLNDEQIERFYAAQCLKDDKMAESIATYLASNKQRKVLHFQGEFHSRDHLGVAEKLHALAPQLKIAVIAPVANMAKSSVKELKNKQKAGELLLLFNRQ